MRKPTLLALHGLLLLLLLILAAVLATFRGALFPFDLRATLLMTASGLARVIVAWMSVWPVMLVMALALPRFWQRLALWPVGLAACLLLHLTIGPERGFAPLAILGVPTALALYLVPVGLVLMLGSALRVGLRRST
ncbi:hypothetical protein FBT96_16055 [Rhodobacter capsulatus]|uniref:Uncharacterized protein n=1 Tax=Rhodobacter capsulatus TaxID=1061 RepID=A0A4V5PNW4_RHOCA|nr:hypothetical protein [Rhodobacter capsulatus]TKD15650.1 hypothetical protein FBT96_16055 [Rhodobacter capsulatus]